MDSITKTTLKYYKFAIYNYNEFNIQSALVINLYIFFFFSSPSPLSPLINLTRFRRVRFKCGWVFARCAGLAQDLAPSVHGTQG